VTATERWLPVVGFEGLYEVSDLGRVRGLRRSGTAGRILAPAPLGRYLAIKLCRDGVNKWHRVHRLVGEAFLGPLPPGQHTRHGPGGALDNRLANLSYGTPIENNHDQDRDGTRRIGSGHPNSKLTEAAVSECRLRHAAGERLTDLAAEYGVSDPTMGKAVRGRTWRGVAEAEGRLF
jgi:hypothetical protein